MKHFFRLTLILMAVSFYKKGALPLALDIQPPCLAEPIQTKTTQAPFRIQMQGIAYVVTPLYAYEICGLIPSAKNYTQWPRGDFYKRVGDNANIADLAMLWGKANTDRKILKNFKFAHSGAWITWRSRMGSDRASWGKFDTNKISNNHILSDSPAIIKQLERLNRWDQVRLKGMLVSYTGGTTRNRASSTSRTDVGNGACEVLYVTHVETLRKASTHAWELLHNLSWVALIGLIIAHFNRPVTVR